MKKFTVIIKRNASYEKGMYGLSIHDQPGGAGNVEPINSEGQLRERLIGFGFSEVRAKGVIESLKDKGDSVKLEDVATRILARGAASGVTTAPRRSSRTALYFHVPSVICAGSR